MADKAMTFEEFDKAASAMSFEEFDKQARAMMPVFEVEAGGKTYEVQAPDLATASKAALAYAPAGGGPQLVPAGQLTPDVTVSVQGAPLDVIGRLKAHLTAEPPAGDPRANPVAGFIRSAGRAMLPGSVPNLAALAAMSAIPGAGLLPSAARIGGAGAAAGAAGAAMGQDPLTAGATGALEGLGGETLGGLARATMRGGMAAASRDLPKLGAAIGRVIPGLAKKTPEQQVAALVSGEASQHLSRAYQAGLEGLFQQHGDPIVRVPSMARLFGDETWAIRPASEMMTRLRSVERSLGTMTGELKTNPKVLEQLELIERAKGEMTQQLRRVWPPEALNQLAAVRGDYAKGRALIRLFAGGPNRPTEERVGQVVAPQGDPLMPQLQTSFLRQGRDLRGKLSPEDYQLLDQALRRGASNPLTRDVPGTMPSVSWWGPLPHVHGLPHLPVRIGRPENLAELAARAMRPTGGLAAGSAVE